MSSRKFRVVLDGEVYEVEVSLESGEEEFSSLIARLAGAQITRVEEGTPKPVRKRGAKELTSEVVGRVVKVCVAKGQKVRKGDVVIVLESMKTQIEVRSDRDGVVESVLVKEGDTVKRGDTIVIFE